MKNLLLTVYLISSLVVGFSQSISFSFQGEDTQTNNSVSLESVFIQNLNFDCDTTIYGANPSITLTYQLGIDETSLGRVDPFSVVSTAPNPFEGSTFVNINLNEKQNLYISLMNLQGGKVADFSKNLPKGSHQFKITCSNHKLLILNVSDGTFSKSIKLLNISSDKEKDIIMYAGTDVGGLHKKQEINETSGFVYHLGDQMLFTASATGYSEDMIGGAPVQSTDYTFQMDPLPLQEGFFIVGSTTPCPELNLNGLMKITKNEVVNEDREELKEIYMAVEEGGSGFNIVQLIGSSQITYGPGEDFALVPELELNWEDPKNGLWRGSLIETADKFVLPENGLYHIALDEEIMIVVIAKVDWGVIGGATPGGWGVSTDLLSSQFNLNAMTFEIPEITMLENEWRFRYSNGWKIVLDADFDNGTATDGLKVNTNFGGQIDDLVAGGDNFINDEYAIYKITMNWQLGVGHTASYEWVGEAEPFPEYPDTMYIVGAATAYGWDTPGTIPDAIMHTCAGGVPSEGIFWKICHIDADEGFKVSDAGWGPFNFGYADIDEFDPNGVTIVDDYGNFSLNESGVYIIVLDLRNETVQLSIKEAEVYGMGDTFGGWDEDVPANLFTVDNTAKTVTSPALVADGDIRIYAQHTWIPSWWNAEFNVYSGVIEYRNDGDDQDAVPGTTAEVITLMFDDNTGTIN